MDLPEDIPEHSESKAKKAVMVFLGIFLIFLITSYVALSYGVGDVLAGLAESSLIEDNRAVFKNGEIVFTGGTFQDLAGLWDEHDGLEFKVCFLGEKKENTYFVNAVYAPKMIEQTYKSVLAEDCPAESLVVAHSHPFRRCIASFQDVLNHKRFREQNPDALMAVLCDKNRMNVYP